MLDNVLVNVDSVLYWHVVDVYQATFAVRYKDIRVKKFQSRLCMTRM